MRQPPASRPPTFFVTAEGVHAHDFCQGFKSSDSQAYDVDQPDTTGTLMCRYTPSDGTTVTVGDKGPPQAVRVCGMPAAGPAGG
jgi:hypothetical protein